MKSTKTCQRLMMVVGLSLGSWMNGSILCKAATVLPKEGTQQYTDAKASVRKKAVDLYQKLEALRNGPFAALVSSISMGSITRVGQEGINVDAVCQAITVADDAA